jgi:hypothetical protein
MAAEALLAKPTSKQSIGELFGKYEHVWLSAVKGTGNATLHRIAQTMREDGVSRSDAKQWFDMYGSTRREQGQTQKHAKDWENFLKTL